MTKLRPYTFRLDDEHREMLSRVAAAHGRDESNMLRYLLKQEAQRLGLVAGAPAPVTPPASVQPTASEPDAFDFIDD